MDSIEFKPFVFPKWSVYKKLQKGLLWRMNSSLCIGLAKDDWHKDTKKIIAYVKYGTSPHSHIEIKEFPYTSDGYADSKKWVADKKKELAEALCG